MANEQNLRPAKKGEVRNPNGRPRKFVSALKEQGYKMSEVNDAIQVLMSMTLEELADTFKNPNATILEKTVANALKKSLEKGSLYSLDTLMSRVYGKPKETVSQEVTINTVNVKVVESIVPLANSENEIK
jgi:poly-beta-hydroxyalkanoate depolymerase